MINYLQGNLISVTGSSAVLDVQGVGYEIELCQKCLHKLPAINSKILIHTYLSIKEDAHTLFGFLEPKLKQLFMLLITVNGIGAKMAINILSKIEPNDFITAINTSDTKYLIELPAIGKKTAGRIILDLKDKASTLNFAANKQNHTKTKEDAASALQTLGFKRKNIEVALNQCSYEESTAATIKQALQILHTQ